MILLRQRGAGRALDDYLLFVRDYPTHPFCAPLGEMSFVSPLMNCPGVRPSQRLNALQKLDASEYPSAMATVATVVSPSRKSSFALR
jgi:hypothetical protein